MTPEEDDLFQARAAQAHEATDDMLHRLFTLWGVKDVNAAGFVTSGIIIAPALSGVIAALTRIAWDISAPGSTAEEVGRVFYAAAMTPLENHAADRDAGRIITDSAVVAADVGYGATRQ